MSLTGMTPAVSDRFDALCRAVAARGRGLTLPELGATHTLARELEADEPDQERVEELAATLGLDQEDPARLAEIHESLVQLLAPKP